MFTRIKAFFSAPVFDNDEEKTRTAGLLNTILLGTITLLLFTLIAQSFFPAENLLSTTLILGATVGVFIGLWFLMRKGNVRLASIVFVTAGWIAMTIQAFTASGLRDTAIFAYMVVIVAAGLLISVRASVGYAIASMVAGWIFAILEIRGRFSGIGDTPSSTARDFSIIFLLVALVVYLLGNSLNRALSKSRANEAELKIINQDLTGLRTDLETRVSERTNELQEAKSQAEKRAIEFEAISEVARAISAEQGMENLLPQITRLISDHFGFYHVGIFLLNETGKYALLRASNSPGGQKMLERGHRLEVGQVGIVGNVTATGNPRIALDVGEDAVYFSNPDLPETRSEMALPLKISGRIIGALDVQSKTSGAFSQENVQTLSILADQVAIAIETARLFSETQRALLETQALYRQSVTQAWTKVATEKRIGYLHTEAGGFQLSQPLGWEEAQTALERGESVIVSADVKTSHEPAIAIPLLVHEQTIGVLDVRSINPNHKWTDREINLIKSVAERLGLALENARLFEETAARAARERAVSEITSKIRATTDAESMLTTAINELKKVLGTNEISIHPLTDNLLAKDTSTPKK